MITITPKESKESVVKALDAFIAEKISTKQKFLDTVLNHGSNNLAQELFYHHGLSTERNKEGITQFTRITRIGLTQLYDAYMLVKYGIISDSVRTQCPETGILRTPMTSVALDKVTALIIEQSNAFWLKNKSAEPLGIGEIIYDIFEPYDHGIVEGLNYRLENEAKPKPSPARKNFVKEFKERWFDIKN